MRVCLYGLLCFILAIAGPVVAQEEDPCVLQDEEGTLHVICNVCGDGVVDSEEACDDANTVDGDGCSSSCQREALSPSDTATQEELLETGPNEEDARDPLAPPVRKLPTSLLSVGPDDTPSENTQDDLEALSPTPAQVYQQNTPPEQIQSAGAARLSTMIATRNIKDASLTQEAMMQGNSFILPAELAATGRGWDVLSLIMILLGISGLWASWKWLQ